MFILLEVAGQGGSDNSPIEVLNLMSISAVVAASAMITQIIKKLIPITNPLAKLPVFTYVIAIAIVLAIIANKLLKTPDGSPMLEGSLVNVIWAAIVSAAGASGFFTWLNNPKSMGAARVDNEVPKPPPAVLVLLPLMLFLGGCVNYEKAILREGMDGMMQTIMKDHKEWSDAMTIDPETGKNHINRLPVLTPAQKKQIEALYQEYNALVDEDRQRDMEKLGGNK